MQFRRATERIYPADLVGDACLLACLRVARSSSGLTGLIEDVDMFPAIQGNAKSIAGWVMTHLNLKPAIGAKVILSSGSEGGRGTSMDQCIGAFTFSVMGHH